jgi:hypothetical protein
MSELFGTLGRVPIDHPLQEEVATLAAVGGSTVSETRVAIQGGIDPQQFTLLQLTDGGLADLHDVRPNLAGSEDAPDVQTRIQLVSLHMSDQDREANAGHQASLRLDIGKDPRSSSQLEPLLWSVAAGIDLIGCTGEGRNARIDADLSAGFKQRPIEIPNGMAQLRIEIVTHPEPPAWRRYFSFLARSDETKLLVSVLGFPGITIQAANLIDQLMGAVDEARAQVLFRSRPLSIAMNGIAVTDFKAGLYTVSVAGVNDGYLVMTRFADMHRLLDMKSDIEFRGGDGLLVRKGSGILGEEFDHITYAVLRIRSKSSRIESLV